MTGAADMDIPTGSAFHYKRDRDPEEEKWSGRYILDFAYALGCLAAIGDADALPMLKRVGWAENKKVKRALIDQFRAGMKHERARGAPTRESDDDRRRL